jgi:tRNA threonylcarbamoyladenosine modification (KEOPS) complex  Pcc1 subunit
LANAHFDLKDASFKDAARATLVTYGRLIQVEMDIIKTMEATAKATSILSAAIPGSHQLILKSVQISAKE